MGHARREPVPAKPSLNKGLTREQLVNRQRGLEAAAVQTPDATKRLIADLELHQVALEVQNRELRETQLAVEESRAKLADLYDFAPVVYITLDQRGRITDANLTAGTVLGIGRALLLGRHLNTLVVPADAGALRVHIKRCCEERVRVETALTFSVRGKPGMTAQVASVPLLTADGKVAGMKTTLTDITALKRAQEKLAFLAQASATLGSSFDYRANLRSVARLAVSVLADICIVDLVDERGELERLEVATADPRKAEKLGALRTVPPRRGQTGAIGQVMRTRAPLLFQADDREALTSTAGPFEHEPLVARAGARSMILVPLVVRDAVIGIITLIAAESGRRYTETTLATARDLAAHAALAIDNARLYEQTRKAVRTREDLLAFVSHDLRNPLMGILLTTETLLRAGRGAEERRKGWPQLERIRRGAQHMRHMIDDLFDMAALDSGRLMIVFAAQDVKRLFEDSALVLDLLAAEKQINLAFDVQTEGLAVRCDRERVIQILSNLIGNSIKFTPVGGTVTVTARDTGVHAVFIVSDTGPGIAPASRARVFDRFWQADDSAQKGRGLGLYIVKGLVEAQGGTIQALDGDGRGATFSFTLPLASAAEAAVDRRDAPAPPAP